MTTHTLTFTTEELEALGLAIAARVHRIKDNQSPDITAQRVALDAVADRILLQLDQPK